MLSPELNQYLTDHSHPLSGFLQSILENTEQNLESSHMISGPQTSSILRMLTRILNPKLVLDLGTYTGFSALSIAEVLGESAKIITCDIDPLHLKIAKENFKHDPSGAKIEVFEGSVFDCLEHLKSNVDMVFLDANKNTYIEYYEAIIPLLRPGGMLIVDDMLWKGRAISPTKIREMRMDLMNKRIRNDNRVENILLPVRNGLNIVYKL